MDKRGNTASHVLARFRGFIQAAATLITNIHLPNFAKGGIYQGAGKTVCVPGLNCYSCPAASGACPIGSFQSVVGSSKFNFSYYVTGTLILLGVLLGRFVCGFLCPFGWLQELLHKIPGKKFSTKTLKPLTYIKYAVLLFAVVLLPVLVVNDVGMGDPFFCKYICPQGVLEGAIPLSIMNTGIRSALGKLFTWKLAILIAVAVLSVLFYRPFCKWICPLGAFYALMNKVSLLGIQVDQCKCVSCGKCAKVCLMDVDVTRTPDHAECIRCGKCVGACPVDAISFRYGLGVTGDKPRSHAGLRKQIGTYISFDINGGTMKLSKIAALLMLPVLALTLAACSAPKGDAKDATSGDAQIAELVAQKPSSAEEAAKLYQQLLQKENEIFASDNALWEKVFLAANKDTPMIEDGKNYGDFLLDTIEGAKDQFAADELKTLKAGAQQVKEIEDKLMALEKEFPGCGSTPGEGESVDASTAGMTNGESGETKFPSFKGKDLDGNDVNSDELFSKNKVTVMNFWFTTCKPCVGELGDLEKLNKELAEKGGQVVGVNSFTLDGKKDEVADAKDVLSKKGVTYKNIWFKSDSEAGKFTSNLYSFPTTYVIDQNGNIVGEPIMGGINSAEQREALNKLIDQALAKSEQ